MPAATLQTPLPREESRSVSAPKLHLVAWRLIVFAVFFGGTLALLHRVASTGGGGLVGSKLEHYLAQADRYDTVFLGSSHVYRSFRPEQFDAALTERDLPSSSFNFGVQMPNLLESHYLMRALLAAGEGRLRRVFFEYQSLVPQIDPDQAFIPRNVYWHDWVETSTAFERIAALDQEVGLEYAEGRIGQNSILTVMERLTLSPPARMSSDHFQHFLKRLLLVGRSKDVGRGLLGRQHGLTASFGPGRGYVSLEAEQQKLVQRGRSSVENNLFLRRREAFLADREEYELRVDRVDTEPVYFGDEEWLNADLQRLDDVELIRILMADAKKAGCEFILVIMPSNSCDRELEEQLIRELDCPVLRYNLPGEFGQFYAFENHFDSGHLTEQGAIQFTDRLARDYLKLQEPGQ